MPLTRRGLLSALALGVVSPVASALFNRRLKGELAAHLSLRISQVELDIAPGHTVKTTAYNGSVAGTPIRLKEAHPTTVEIINESDREEFVHWHGFLISAEVDGTPEERSLPVPSRSTVRYSLTAGPSGMRFVHSHSMVMGDLTQGLYSGQFAPVYVEPKINAGSYDQEIFLTTHEWEAYLASDDEQESSLESPLHQIRNERMLIPCGSSGVTCEVGYGIASINGRALGYGEPLRVKQGQRVLVHVINASATENISLALPGHRFLVTALDGNAVPTPQLMDVLELGASERVDVIVEMTNPGVWVFGSTDPDYRDMGLGIVVEYAGRTGTPIWNEAPESTWDYTKFGSAAGNSVLVEEIRMVIDRAPFDGGLVERWMINGKSYDPKDEPQALRKNKRYRLAFKNRTDEDHPLHLHRSRFELTNINGKPTSGVLKDVVVVRGFETTAVDFTPEESGLMLFHCHNQLHMDSGFMKLFNVL